MDQHVLSATVGLVAALIAWKAPHVGQDSATALAQYLVVFVVGWFLPQPHKDGPPLAGAPQLVVG